MKRDEKSIYTMILATCLTEDQYRAVQQLAESEYMCMSTFLRRLCLKELKQHGMLPLQSKSPSNRK